ncbi:uncharacterized protein SPAPADRAFT_60651 [Spathaspora passalidarum NRRL Y-27907]|uniref:Thioesterase domain-containing protein n=1 Tax=Spathaspora passalidarum (strain NRRL Y-27907 / 11-Y1) TaxID=619300 RepID=G3ALR8_SPAPN|nr:uncharacterized protein SPAPADRAFT_60651 [Spathaspora passalidarum NRRL Y-27907]EGW33311.1 hypothetical protein SPAPADRAFT_60651 [Spathaspora passalidarum NRRL Y-27907]
MSFRGFVCKTIPIVAFGVGIASFPRSWRKEYKGDPKLLRINESVLNQIQDTELYKTLQTNNNFKQYNSSHAFPGQHHSNYIGTGLLFGPDLFEIDPIVFLNEEKGELVSFYHLGESLISQDGQIHNGVTSTILDEGLCSAGFPLLPAKKGVTASLSIDFKNQAPPRSTVILRAKVKEAKGRKVVIEGYLETLSFDLSVKPTRVADAKCVLVQPKWFKYLQWLQI